MELFFLNINAPDKAEYKRAYSLMSEARRLKCDSYLNSDDKKRCIAADMLARDAISRFTGAKAENIQFGFYPGGKPFAENLPVFFSVSHSGEYAAVGVSADAEVGVDIEFVRPVNAGVLRWFCSGTDMSFIADGKALSFQAGEKITDSETLKRVFRVWTFKEAFFKCTGEGIGKSASGISFEDFEKLERFFDGYAVCAVEGLPLKCLE